MDYAKDPLSLALFLSRIDGKPTWQRAKHLQFISDELMKVFNGDNLRLIITIPPGHAKSTMISYVLPVFWLNQRPQDRIILTSASRDFASKWGREVRDAIQNNEPFLNVKVDKSNKSMTSWGTTAGGSMCSIGLNGQTTGRRAELFVVDDPAKDAASAVSLSNKIWEWFRGVAETRLTGRLGGNKPGRVIILMTRWTDIDLVGKIIKQQKKLEESGELEEEYKWKIINLPGIAKENDPLGRKPGEALWPELLNEADHRHKKQTLTPYMYSALYDGMPGAAEGNVVDKKWIKRYDELPVMNDSVKFMTVDLDLESEKDETLSTAQSWVIETQTRQLFLVDQKQIYTRGPEQEFMIRRMKDEFQPAFIFMDKEQCKLAVVRKLMKNLPIRKCVTDSNLMAKFLTAINMMSEGKILLNSEIADIDNIESEILVFPMAEDSSVTKCISIAALSANKIGSKGVPKVTITNYRPQLILPRLERPLWI